MKKRPKKGDAVLALGARDYEGVVVSARRRDTVEVQYHLPDGRAVGKVEETRSRFVWKVRSKRWIVRAS